MRDLDERGALVLERPGGERVAVLSGEVRELRLDRTASMSLLLTIDAGNTNTVLGVHEGDELRAHWRLTTRREQTADEYGILVRNLFAGSGRRSEAVVGVALASVVPPLTPVLVVAVAAVPRA